MATFELQAPDGRSFQVDAADMAAAAAALSRASFDERFAGEPPSQGGLTDYLPRAITDVHKEGSKLFGDTLDAVTQNLNPFSFDNGSGAQNRVGTEIDPARQLDQTLGVGKGLAAAAALPFAYPMGAARSLIGHPVASLFEYGSALADKAVRAIRPDLPPLNQTHEQLYGEIAPRVDTLLGAMGVRAPIGRAAVTAADAELAGLLGRLAQQHARASAREDGRLRPYGLPAPAESPPAAGAAPVSIPASAEIPRGRQVVRGIDAPEGTGPLIDEFGGSPISLRPPTARSGEAGVAPPGGEPLITPPPTAARILRERPDALPPLPERAQVTGTSQHGPVVEGLHDRWAEAVTWIRQAESGDAIGVLSHPDVPGRIDVVWGKYDPRTDVGYGLAKIAFKHSEMLPDLPERLTRMRKVTESKYRITLATPDGNERAVVASDFAGEPKSWLLTAYDRRRRGGEIIETPAGLPGTDHSPSPPAEGNIAARAPDVEVAGGGTSPPPPSNRGAELVRALSPEGRSRLRQIIGESEITPENLAELDARIGPHGFLAELDPSLTAHMGAIAAVPGQIRSAMTRALSERRLTAPRRIEAVLTGTLGPRLDLAKAAGLQDAVRLGRRVWRADVTGDDIARLTAGLSERAYRAFQSSAREAIGQLLDATSKGRLRPRDTFLAEAGEEKLRRAFGDEKADRVIAALAHEDMYARAPTRIVGGVPAQPRMEALADPKYAKLRGEVAQIMLLKGADRLGAVQELLKPGR